MGSYLVSENKVMLCFCYSQLPSIYCELSKFCDIVAVDDFIPVGACPLAHHHSSSWRYHMLYRPQNEEGQGLVEYALILVLVAVVVIVVLAVLGPQLVTSSRMLSTVCVQRVNSRLQQLMKKATRGSPF